MACGVVFFVTPASLISICSAPVKTVLVVAIWEIFIAMV